MKKEEDLKKENHLKQRQSEVTINGERMFGSLEELMTYIGSSYPHYRKTVFPILVTYFFLYFVSRFILEARQLKLAGLSESSRIQEFFYSKCFENNMDDSLKVSQNLKFITVNVPKGELTIVINAFFMFATTTISPKHLVMFCLIVITISYLLMAHLHSEIQMSMYFSLSFTEIYRMVAFVAIAESVPKFHRLPALILLELVRTSSHTLTTVFVRLPSEIPLDFSRCFGTFGFFAIIVTFYNYYTFQDSLYSLLARSKTDQMQDRVTEIFRKSEIPLAPDAVIDEIAFEHFENNTNPIEILLKTLTSLKLIQEVLVCGVISGISLTVDSFVEAQTLHHSEIMYFEKSLLPWISSTFSGALLIILSVVMPKRRILPVLFVIPILFLVTSLFYMMIFYFKTYDKCSQQFIISNKVLPYYIAVGVFVTALTDIIRFLVKVHLIEVMPALIRTPITSILLFVQYSFDGKVRELYSTKSISGEMILVLISILAMLILLITPRKTNDMNVFFCEYNNNDRKRKIPPAPEFVN